MPMPMPMPMVVMIRHYFILSLLLFTDLSFCAKPISNKNEYLKLKLLHKNPFDDSPSKAVSSDSHRLSVLYSTLNHQKTFKSPVISGASTGSGQYFVEFQVGTPPQKILLVADTGSDLVWVKCSACRNCSNHQPGTSFFPRHSSTFYPFHCYDSSCQLVPNPSSSPLMGCNQTRLHSPCRYEYSYGDGSITSGFFSKELTTLKTSSGRQARVRNLAFGCGFNISGSSVSGSSFNGAHGVMGLGQGPISFSTQVGKKFGNKFSYCLMDYTISPPPTSFLLIGNSHKSRKPKFNFTPLQANPLSPTFYYIGIDSVKVNGIKLKISPSVWEFDSEGNGGTVIDSGTTLTFINDPAYSVILRAFERRVKLPRISDPGLSFDFCVNISGVKEVSLPSLSFRFMGNSVFSPPVNNYFIDAAEDVKCLALQRVNSPGGFSVIGNLMQQGFLFEFDRDESRLGFTRQGCAE